MKGNLFMFIIMAVLMTACNDDAEALYEMAQTPQEHSVLSRSISIDSISDGTLVVDSLSEEILQLRESLLKLSTKRNAISPSTYDDYDQWFSSNMYAIRDLPVTIQVRGVANGCNQKYSYLNCSGAGQEVTLSSSSTSASSKFFIKVLPASTGIPYLIYTNIATTPLTIGHYNNAPNVKILMSQENDNKLSDFAGWDLIASSQNKGYFAIKNNMYIGQYDESNPWSIFYYNLEAISCNKLGFAQPQSNKAQQEFEIIPCDTFLLSSIQYDLGTKTITPYTESYYGTGQNLSSQEGLVNVNFNFDADETSNFNTRNNSLKVKLKNTNVEIPFVSGGGIMQPGSDTDRTWMTAPFTYSGDYHSHRKIQFTLKRNCPGRHNIEVRAHFVKYKVSLKFTAKAYFKPKDGDERLFTITGTWSGILFDDPSIVKPDTDDPEYTKIDGGGTDIPIIIPGTKKIEPVDSLKIIKPYKP